MVFSFFNAQIAGASAGTFSSVYGGKSQEVHTLPIADVFSWSNHPVCGGSVALTAAAICRLIAPLTLPS